jgi:predicted amidohydrolase
VFICNDVWHPSLPYLGICQKADVFVTILNSTKGSMGKEFSNIDSWGIINTFYARVFGIYHVCANRVGSETIEVKEPVTQGSDISKEGVKDAGAAPTRTTYHFWGGSEIIGPFGKQVAKAALHEPDEIMAEISRNLLRQKRILLPYLRNDDPYFTHRQLDRILYE